MNTHHAEALTLDSVGGRESGCSSCSEISTFLVPGSFPLIFGCNSIILKHYHLISSPLARVSFHFVWGLHTSLPYPGSHWSYAAPPEMLLKPSQRQPGSSPAPAAREKASSVNRCARNTVTLMCSIWTEQSLWILSVLRRERQLGVHFCPHFSYRKQQQPHSWPETTVGAALIGACFCQIIYCFEGVMQSLP